MTVPPSNQIYLLFSPKSIPFAELLFYSIHLRDLQPLKVGIHSNLLSKSPTLIIPKGVHATTKTTLVGKSSILRFFSRLAKSKVDPFKSFEADLLFEKLRTTPLAEKSLLETLANIKKPFTSSTSSDISAFGITECMAYEYLCASQKPPTAGKIVPDGQEWFYAKPTSTWWASFQNNTHIVWAQNAISNALKTVPFLTLFKSHAIEQMEKQTSLSTNDLSRAMQNATSGSGVSFNVFLLKLGAPAEVAAKLIPKFQKNDYIIDITQSGPFINFMFNTKNLYGPVITQAMRSDLEYGTNSSGFGQFALCEFSSPNIAKPFHAGHLRSTIIGSFIQKLLTANGWRTLSINYLGDWGKQYGLLAVGFEKYGSEEELEKDPIKHLFDVYVKINQDASENESIHDEARSYFKKMEDGDEKALDYWRRFRDLSIVAYKKIYARINVHFDLYSGESQYSLEQMRGALNELQEKKLLTTLEGGAMAVDLTPYDLGTAVIGKTDGSMLYLSRDIAAASHRQQEYGFDKMYYVVATQQHHHFKQLFKILELEGKTWGEKCHHIDFGLIKSKDGNMSTRKGTVVFLQQILDHVKEEMHEVMKKNETKYAQIEDPEQVSDIVGISAIMIQDMSARRHKDYAFDWNRMLSFEGDTGPYLQYAHARLCSIERNAKVKATAENVKPHLSLLVEKNANELVDLIAQYPELVQDLTQSLEPCTLVKYAWKLSHAVSSAYTDLWVHGQEENIALARLGLYSAARITLGNSLRLLGLQPLERM